MITTESAKLKSEARVTNQRNSKRSLTSGLGRLLPERVKQRLALEMSIRSIRSARKRCLSVEDLCSLTFRWTGYGACHSIRSLQHYEEEVAFFERVAEHKPRSALEIGTCNGGTLFVLMALAARDAHVISLDLPGGIHGGGYGQYQSRFFLHAFPSAEQRLSLVRADSHLDSTADQVKALLGGQPLDYLFIDGDHRYEGVRRDFLLYGPHVKKGGMIAFHDIAPIHHAGVDVPKFWNEIKSFSESTEFIRPQLGNELLVGGIGVFTNWDPAALESI